MAQTAPQKFIPPPAVRRLSAQPPVGAAAQPITEKKAVGLWQKANMELPRTQTEKEQAKQALEEDMAKFKAEQLHKEQEEAAKAAPAPVQPIPAPAADEDAIIEGGEDDDDDEEEAKPAPEKAKPRTKRLVPPPMLSKKQAASEVPHTNGAPIKLNDAQQNHLNYIYGAHDMLKQNSNSLSTYLNTLFSMMPALGMLDQLNQMRPDQLIMGPSSMQPMAGRFIPPPQHIAWGTAQREEDNESDSEAEAGSKKRSKKQSSRPAKKPAKEDKYAAKNILSEDGEEAALTIEEDEAFMQKINTEFTTKVSELDASNIQKKLDSTTSNIRGFFNNNGTSIDNYTGKERALVLSLAAYIRTVWPHLVADASKPEEKGNSRAHILTRIARAYPTTLTDKTSVGALIKRDGLTRVFIEAFANVIAYYYIFLTKAGVSVVEKAE